MNYATYLLQLLAGLPLIAQFVQSFHAGKSADQKIAAGSNLLQLATQEISQNLSPENANLAAIAGGAAQSILAVTVQAVHDAHAGVPPTLTPAPIVDQPGA